MTRRRPTARHRVLFLLVALAIGAAGSCRHREPPPPLPALESLVPVSVLREHLRREEPPLVVDTRRPGDYGVGHLPGAVNLPLEDVGRVPDDGLDTATRDRLRGLLVDAGVRPGLPVIAVDEGSPRGFTRAATLCWLLALADHDDCHVLEGGVEAWGRARGRLVTARFVPVRPGMPPRIPARPPAYAPFEDLRRATAAPETAIVDVRDEAAPGGIPGSLRIPLPPVLSPGGMVDRARLAREAEAAGAYPETDLIVLGEDLPSGAAAWFLLERVLGIHPARVYPGGFDRYLSWPFLPGATADPPAGKRAAQP